MGDKCFTSINWIKLWSSLWDQVPSVGALHTNFSHEQHLNDCCTVGCRLPLIQVLNSYHKTKRLLNIKVRRWGTLPIEHAPYIDILYVILTNLFSLPFVVLQNFRNSSSIFFVFDLTSGDSVLANFSTTVIHTATHHKWYSQNIFNCTNSRAKFWRGDFF